MQAIHSNRRWQVPLLAASLALLIIASVLVSKRITPFGDQNFLISDLGTQYVPLFTAYRHALIHGFRFYSFSQSLGSGVMATWAYYLMSPFNLIFLLFPADKIPLGVSLLLMAKVSAIAGTTTHYLQRHFHNLRWSTALFGVAFSLCGFVALNFLDLMWLDALVWLPLVLDGLDTLMRTGQQRAFFGWLWVGIVTNFYMGYMLCLFVICYFIYQLVDQETVPLSWQARWHANRSLIGRTLLTGCLSVLSTTFLLIPTAMNLLQTAKTANHLTNFLPVPQYDLSILSQLGVGASNYTDRLQHAPALFTTTWIVLLVWIFFVHPQFSTAHKWHGAAFLLVLLLSMGVRTLDTVWHLFQQPEGFPFRDAYFVSFVMILLAFDAWQAGPQRIARHWRWGVPIGLSLALILGYATSLLATGSLDVSRFGGQPMPLRSLDLQMLSVVLTAGVLFGTRRQWRTGLVGGLVLTELAGNFDLALHGAQLGSQTTYQAAYQAQSQQLARLSDASMPLARVNLKGSLLTAAFREVDNHYNDPQSFHLSGLSAYSSTLNDSLRRTLKSLGLFSQNARRISGEGLSPVTALLLGVQTDVGFSPANRVLITPNSASVGGGFAVPDALTRLKLSSTNALANQEALLQSLAPAQAPYFHAATILNSQTTVNHVSQTYHDHHVIRLRVTTTGPLYYDDLSGATKYRTLQVNGIPHAPTINANGHRLLWDLGTFRRGTIVTLSVTNDHYQDSDQVRLASLSTAQFHAARQQLARASWQPRLTTRWGQPTLQGTVQNTTGQHWFYVALPAEAAWHATVNGHRVTSQQVLGSLTAVPLQAGTNHVQLTYQTPGLTLGIGLSVVGLLGFASDQRWRKRRSRPGH